MIATDRVAELFEEHRSHLWGLGYRMLGTGPDADEVVQDTFVRLLESPPKDLERPLRPWLVRVLVNLSRDRLRERKARPYVGSWLPGPLDSQRWEALLAAESPDAEGRALARESLSLAFLLALEVLPPTQRAVFVLRSALGYSTREAAAALELSEANVKTSLHRARRALEASPPRIDSPEVTGAVLFQLSECLASGDTERLLTLLAPEVSAISDSGGDFVAARLDVLGAERVARFLIGLAQHDADSSLPVELHLNGQPAFGLVRVQPRANFAPRAFVRVELDEAAKIRQVWIVTAPAKLTGLPLSLD